MADQAISVTSGSGNNVDTRTESTNGNHRQVIVLGDPSINDNVVSAVTADPGSSSTTPGIVMRLAGSATVVGTGSAGSPAGGVLSIQGVTSGQAVPVSGTITGITNSLNVYLGSTAGTLQVKLDPSSVLSGITSSVNVRISETAGTLQVKLDPASVLSGITSTVGVRISETAGTLQVKLDPSSTISGILSTVGVRISETAGTLQVKLDPSSVFSGITSSVGVFFSGSKPTVFADAYHTASIFTVSGSTSGGTTSGVTLVAPSANYNFKVFAFNIQSTAVSSTVWRFVNGAAAGQTEFWRPLILAASSSSAPVGANLAVPPPAYLFATGTSTTLALHSDTGSLVHYSISYIKETA